MTPFFLTFHFKSPPNTTNASSSTSSTISRLQYSRKVMLTILNARPKPWIVTTLSFTHHNSDYYRLTTNLQPFSVNFPNGEEAHARNHYHSSACRIVASRPGGAGSIWHAIFPSTVEDGGNHNLVNLFHHEQKGEGSWNVAWDVRPARWLHSSDSAWLLFGVCGCGGGGGESVEVSDESLTLTRSCLEEIYASGNNVDRCSSEKYKVIGVPGDGRCLFRAITYGACLNCGDTLPDENRQRELADDLRAQVVDELLKRREEIEWIIEGDFDMYVKNIQRPNEWGGEPELVMASHVLRMPISVSMIDRRSGELINIASYGHEYGKDKLPIQVLFHGYGHYDVLEISLERN